MRPPKTGSAVQPVYQVKIAPTSENANLLNVLRIAAWIWIPGLDEHHVLPGAAVAEFKADNSAATTPSPVSLPVYRLTFPPPPADSLSARQREITVATMNGKMG